jgi:hypothetical protein
MKTEVYSWRVTSELKSELQRAARRRKLSLSAVLDLAARRWLTKSGADIESDGEQLRLQKLASKCFGAFAGGNSSRSENVRQLVRQGLKGHYGR